MNQVDWPLVAPILFTSYHGTNHSAKVETEGVIKPGVTEEGTREVDRRAGDHRRVFLAPGVPRYRYPGGYFRFDTRVLIERGAGLRPSDLLEDYSTARSIMRIGEIRDNYTFYHEDAVALLAAASLGLAMPDEAYWQIPLEAWTSQEARRKIDWISTAIAQLTRGLPPPESLKTRWLQSIDMDITAPEDYARKLRVALDTGDWAMLYEHFNMPTPNAVHEGFAWDLNALWYEVRPPHIELVWDGPLSLSPDFGYLGTGLDLPFPTPEWLLKEVP